LDNHPSLEDLTEFLEGRVSAQTFNRDARIVRHLLADCPTCRNLLKRVQRRPAEPPSYDYEAAFATAAALSLEFLSSGRKSGPGIPRQPSPSAARFSRASPHRARELLAASHTQRYVNPDEMLRFAEAARYEADACLAADAGGEAALEDLRGWCWGQYGNSLRVRGQLEESRLALETAEEHRVSGTGDPRLRARLLEQRAALAIFLRQLDLAIKLNEEAVHIYRKMGSFQLLAAARIGSAIAHLYAGHPATAIQILERTIPLIDSNENKDLLLAACHNLVHCYIDLGRPDEALACHLRLQDLYRDCRDPLILLRGSWLEGLLLREVGHLRNAETALKRAREGFLQRGLTYEGAIISLELAELYWKTGELEKIEEIVKETEITFQALGVDVRILRPLHQFWEATTEGRRPDL
jgi:tetratricopeptide (TPR) repeat protein